MKSRSDLLWGFDLSEGEMQTLLRIASSSPHSRLACSY